MILSTQTDYLGRTFGNENAIRMLKKAGFDAYDFSMFATDMDIICSEKNREYAKKLRAVADEVGIACNQAHAPFPTGFADEKKTEKVFEDVVRSMEVAAILGAKSIVVHPQHHLKYADSAEKLFEINVDFYRRLLPYAEEFGIKIATENMWQRDGRIVHSSCSQPEEFCRYIDAIDSPWLIGCLDVGHVPLVRGDMTEMIKTLGNKRLQALHIHDNAMKDDDHTLPFMKSMNFEEIVRALAEIDYQGDFTLEADNFFLNFPKEFAQQASSFMCETGRFLMSQIEAYKKLFKTDTECI